MPSEKQFCVEEALDRAMEAFWEAGYEATSMTQLLERMGIQKGSFYATFTSKHNVYVQAVERYVRVRFAQFETSMAGLPPREAIAKMIDGVQAECQCSEGTRGCFVINAALELAPTDDEVGRIVRDTLTMHQKWLGKLIKRGQAAGDIPPHVSATTTAKSLLGLIISMRVYSRAGMPATYTAAARTQALGLLD